MKHKIAFIIISICTMSLTYAQNNNLPYYEIQDQAIDYTAGSASARMVDGLGFRYYWATEGLREKDLNYKASESGRTSAETIDHIYGLTRMIP